MGPKLFIDDLGKGYLPAIRERLACIDLGTSLKRGDSVFIKPNLTFPVFRKAACKLMRVDPRRVEHFMHVDKHEHRLPKLTEVLCNTVC
jgi:hypothetical protein